MNKSQIKYLVYAVLATVAFAFIGVFWYMVTSIDADYGTENRQEPPLTKLTMVSFTRIVVDDSTVDMTGKLTTDDSTPQVVNFKKGETKYFRFDENPSTGYQIIDDDGQNGGVYVTSSRFERKDDLRKYYNGQEKMLVGAGGIRVIAMTAIEDGTGTFRVAYARRWLYKSYETWDGQKMTFQIQVNN